MRHAIAATILLSLLASGAGATIKTIKTRDAWKLYRPASLGTGKSVPLPGAEALQAFLARDRDALREKRLRAIGERCLAAVKQNPEDTAARGRLALAYARAGFAGKAEEEFAKVLEADPRDVGARMNLANLCYVTGRYDRAIALFRECLELRPDDAFVHLNLSFAYFEKGESGFARRTFERAVELRPDLDIPAYAVLKGAEATVRTKAAHGAARSFAPRWGNR